MDKRYWNRGGEVVEPKRPELADRDKYGYLASLPVIGSIDPSYPVGWVGDDVEMVWQVNTGMGSFVSRGKEYYDEFNGIKRILFLLKERGITITSISGEKKPFIVANVRDILDYWNNGDGCTFSRMVEMFNEVAARQQSAAEIDRLREQVRKLREGLEDCDTLLAHLEDYAHGDGGKMITQQRGKIQQLLTETEG